MKKSDYQLALSKYGESPKALRWVNYRSVAIRYRELVIDLDIEGKSILDIGCGMGDLLPFLYAKTPQFTYLGVDITPEFVDIAKKRYEGHDFKVIDPFMEDLGQRFDIVISSGMLNANTPNWLQNRKDKIKQMFELCNEVLTFNMAGGLKEIQDSKQIAYADAQEIFNFCLSLSSKTTLKTHYDERDFTIIMFK